MLNAPVPLWCILSSRKTNSVDVIELYYRMITLEIINMHVDFYFSPFQYFLPSVLVNLIYASI